MAKSAHPIMLHTQREFERALKQLVKANPMLAPVFAKSGMPTLRQRAPGFAGLCQIVMGQQLSTASAGAIWKRFSAAYDPFHPDDIRRARTDKLGRIGLSAAKIKTVKAIGKAIAQGEIDLEALADLEADAAHAALVALHGIGPWTADIYLLFCLGHADAFPAGDLAVQEAARLAFDLPQRPNAKELTALADAWRPWRGVAAHLLWGYYHVVKRRDGVPVPSSPIPAANGAP